MMANAPRASLPMVSLLLPLLATLNVGCGAGVPIRLQVDEFTTEVSLDEVMDGAFTELQSQGIFPKGSPGLPVLWPESLPEFRYATVLKTDPMPIDLSPEPGTPEAEKFAQINSITQTIRRIELNRLILRIEQSNITMALPEMHLQIADDKDAAADDRLAWRTVGTIPGAEAGYVGDLELQYVPSGEMFLYSQLGDDRKDLAMRVVSRVSLDTSVDRRMPSGKAVLRLILVATFFLAPERAL